MLKKLSSPSKVLENAAQIGLDEDTESKYCELKRQAQELLKENQNLIRELIDAKKTIKRIRQENEFLVDELFDMGTAIQPTTKHVFNPPRKKRIVEEPPEAGRYIEPPAPSDSQSEEGDHLSPRPAAGKKPAAFRAQMEVKTETSSSSSSSSEGDDYSSSSESDE